MALARSSAGAVETESNSLIPGWAVLIISILATVFIAIMAWFVLHMPKK
jgi:hypothetical protein